MLKKLFAKKSSNQICLYLAMDRLSICLIEDKSIRLLAQESVSSELQWQDTLVSLADEHKLQNHRVLVVLSRDFYQTFDIEKPKVEENELMASIPFAVKDLVSESIFDLVVDYYDIPLQQHKGEQITVVCTPQKLVISIRDMIIRCDMQLTEISTEELSLARLLSAENETNILLSQESNALVLTVVKNGQLSFTHRLRGFNELLAVPIDENDDTFLGNLSLELQRALDYINSQLRITSVTHLYLALVCPDIKQLAEQLSTYLARNVQPFGDENQYDFMNIVAYGLLMDELDK